MPNTSATRCNIGSNLSIHLYDEFIQTGVKQIFNMGLVGYYLKNREEYFFRTFFRRLRIFCLRFFVHAECHKCWPYNRLLPQWMFGQILDLLYAIQIQFDEIISVRCYKYLILKESLRVMIRLLCLTRHFYNRANRQYHAFHAQSCMMWQWSTAVIFSDVVEVDHNDGLRWETCLLYFFSSTFSNKVITFGSRIVWSNVVNNLKFSKTSFDSAK